MLRLQLMGEVRVHLVDLSSLGKVKAAESMQNRKEALTSDTLDAETLKNTCPKIFTAYCAKGSMLYVPTGFLVAESVCKGPLCYGVRKSFFLHEGRLAYKKTRDMLKASGRDVAKMDEVLACHCR